MSGLHPTCLTRSRPVQFDCQHLTCVFLCLCCLLACASSGSNHAIGSERGSQHDGRWLLPQDSRNIVIARNRVRYGGFGCGGHSVRALVESNDIGGTGWVAGGAIFLSMYEYAGGARQRILIPSSAKFRAVEVTALCGKSGQTGVNSFITI